MDLLTTELGKRLGSDDAAKKVLSLAESIFTAYGDEKEVSQEKLNELLNILDNYYNQDSTTPEDYAVYKYQRDTLSLLETDNPNVYYVYNLIAEGYYIKPYFSEKLKEEYPEINFVRYDEEVSRKSEKVYKKTNFRED